MLNILLVEDEIAHSNLIQRYFQRYGDEFTITIVTNLDEAQQFIAEHTPDIAFVDFLLPDGHGSKLLPGSIEAAQFPIVMMTSHGDEATAVESIKSGAIDYVVKSRSNFQDIVHIAQRTLREWDHILQKRSVEERLIQSEATTRTIIESVDEGIILVRDNGYIYLVNRYIENVFGYSRQELQNRSINLLVPETLRSNHEELRQNFMLHAKSRTLGTGRFLFAERKDGSQFPTEISLTPIQISDQKFILCTVLDITEQMEVEKNLRESEERFRSLVDAMDDIIFTLDTEQRYTGVYGHWIEQSGFTLDNFLGKTANELFGDNTTNIHTIANIQALSGEGITYNWTLDSGGKIQHIQTRLSPMYNKDGQVTGLVGVGRDITELELVKQQLEENNRLLETRVHKRTERLNQANKLLIEQINERELSETREREQRVLLESIHEIALIVNSSLDIDRILNCTVENIGKIVPHDALCIALVKANDLPEIVRLYRRHSGSLMEILEKNLLFSEGFDIGTILQLPHRLTLISDLTDSDIFRGEPVVSLFKSMIGISLQDEDDVIGCIMLFSRQSQFFHQTDLDRLEIFTNQITLAIRNAQLYVQAGELAVLQDRQRLARDLHDAVTQTLFSASLLSESLIRFWNQDSEKTLVRLKQLNNLTHVALDEMRTLLFELRLQAFKNTDFHELIQQLLNIFYNRTGLEPIFAVNGADFLLPEATKEVFYRILQEGLNNIQKHARAKQVTITVNYKQNKVQLYLQDDGTGFDQDQLFSDTHMGLRIMRERADDIGAVFSIESHKEHGTVLLVYWEKAYGK